MSIVGTSRQAAAQRRALFKEAFLSNGHNQTRAAITAGFSPKSAHEKGRKLRMELEASGELAHRAKLAAAGAKLHTHLTLQEVARIAYNDPRNFFREDGTLKPPHEWSGDMAATISSIEVVEQTVEIRKDDGAQVKTETITTGRTKKLRFWSKIDALDKAMRHAGLFEKDNRQLAPNLALQVNLIEAPPLAAEPKVTITLKPQP